MTVRETTQVGNPVIRSEAQLVKRFDDAEVQQTIQDLIDSMRDMNLVGMAAPQIGESLRIFVTELRETKLRKSDELDMLRVFINPKIVSVSEKTTAGWEGCGSVAEAGLCAEVERPELVTVEAFNEKGDIFTLEAKGLLARVIQHEIDHLDGVLFVDTADMQTCMSRSEYVDRK